MTNGHGRPDQPGQSDPPVLSSLDPEQTSSDRTVREEIVLTLASGLLGQNEEPDGPRHGYWQASSEAETEYRHGRHQKTRQRVIVALRACHAPAERLWRYQNCGSECYVEVAEDGSKHRLIACYCEDRFCPACGLARGRKIFDELKVLVGNQPTRFITLTRKGDNASLSKAIREVRESFSRLRATDFWTARVKGGAQFLEITRGKDGAHWHVHLHVLCHGLFIDQRQLVDHWRRSSRGSFIVHVRAVPDSAAGIRYGCKYVGKPLHESVMCDPAALLEAVTALKGVRLWQAFGSWFNRPDAAPVPDQVKWKKVGKLDQIITAATRREPWAEAVLRSLGRQVQIISGKPRLIMLDRPPPDEVTTVSDRQ